MIWLLEKRAAIWAFVVAAIYVPGLLSPAFTPRWAAIAIGAPLVSRLDPRRLDPVIAVLGLCAFVAAALSLRMSPDPLAGSLELIYLAILGVVCIAASNLDSLDDIMTGLALGIGLSAAVCVIQSAGWSPLRQTGASPSGLFVNSETLAEFAAPVFLWLVLRQKLALAAVVAVAVILCQSRVATMAVVLGLAYAWRPKSRVLLGLIAAAIVACAVAMLLAWGVGPARFMTAMQRVSLWGFTLDNLSFAGHGLGWFVSVDPTDEYAHSDVLQAMAELGIGAAFFVALPVLIFLNRGSYVERAALIAIGFEALVSFPLHMPASGFVAACLAGFMARRCAPVRMVERVSRDANGRYGFVWSPFDERIDGRDRRSGEYVSARSEVSGRATFDTRAA